MTNASPLLHGTLYIVATPIGNLEDITLRALRTLKEVEYIAAEDTRHTKKLLNHFGIKTKLISYYREQEVQRAEQICGFLAAGHDIAVVTDAGTPCISDPGAVIVQKAMQEDFKIVPIPGASALTAALSCAGINDSPVMFYGFAPPKKNQRRQLLQSLVHADHYSVFYESPHRIEAFVEDAHAVLENRQVFMARELTKSFEEIVQCSLEELLQRVAGKKNRGEFVLILAPGETAPAKEQDLVKLILWYRDHTEISLKDCCKTLAADLGISRSQIYQQALLIWHDKEDIT
ncbi:MAG: 16S rRNA (cytidine(1402)-2'-O)-methyltransferase [Desulfopila sp.]|jgi:16S rRNA (cytidine1402-2'-O)-methyltransferase|nr:16S rRNA (cytidine(1402)-2'-O)-methyltransferase [Desulfopila sp.]